MPDIKKIVFSFIAVVLLPLLFFALLELGLRLVGVGASFEYFNQVEINGQAHYQENPDFADQFYPPSLNIGPLENTFTRDRSPELVRVFVLGGSAALGFPHKHHGFDRLLAAQLREALPSRKIEVINTAMTSVNSHVVYAVAESLPDDSADFAVILMGNNEVVGPYGPGTINQNFVANITLIRGIQALKRTRTWQALSSLISQIKPRDAVQELEWEGMQMFANNAVPRTDPRMDGVYSHYEDNLASVIESLRDKGMHVILSSVPVNLRHSAPFLSVRSPGLSNDRINQWRESTRLGAQNADLENWDKAITHFLASLEIDPGYADTHFRLAAALEGAGGYQEARNHYQQALDLDALRFRADSRLNRIIRDTAATTDDDSLSFVDSAAAFERASHPYQPGWNLLLEHVHYSFPGNHILAAEISRPIVKKLTGEDSFSPLPGAEIAKRVGFPNHDTIGEIRNLQGMIQHPPFPGQSNYVDLQTFLGDQLERVTAVVGTEREVVQRRRDIARSGLADWKIHFELAVLNQRIGNSSAMYYHLNRILELYPHNRESYMMLVEAMSKDGKWDEVIPYLEQSLDYTRGDADKIAETINWLGTAHLRGGDHKRAADILLQLPSKYPDQIGLSLRAYGNLIKFSRDNDNQEDLDRYIEDVQRYAQSLIRRGKDEDYPMLYQRMSQIMKLGGRDAESKEWAEKPVK